MSRSLWLELERKRVLKRAQEIRVEPNSAEVEAELKELYQMEKET